MPFPQSFRAALFDLDGTLVDTAPDLTIALNTVLAAMDRPSFDVHAVRNMIGGGARKLIIHALEQSGGVLGDDVIDRMHKDYLNYYSGAIAVESRPFEGCQDMLEELSSRGIAMGISTNKPQALAESLISELGLRHYFKAIRGWDSVTAPKPDKLHLLETLNAMGERPENAVMIGDSRHDQQAATNAGMPVALVTFGYTAEPIENVPAGRYLQSLREVPELFLSDGS